MFGNMEEKQQEMRKRLSEKTVEGTSGDGAVVVKANANREIINISIKKEAVDTGDLEQLEDLLLVAANRALAAAAAVEAKEAENLLKDMMPPGLGNLGDLFG
ncbi:MAG: YbaB/EbfC family nucleoid-associated protein [Saprospirales bacterium]|nr:YbaB/EbfC family nucleoid-associated protein [Saprospirales bacterium]MBK8489633.1 YbaB/EbfC family nucleoid-associated protein [Saprospirales bacterium]